MSILEYNGSCVIAMAGRDCVAIASDRRFGVQYQTISHNMERVFKMNNRTLIGLGGLATDVHTLKQKLSEEVNIHALTENKYMSSVTFANLVSSTLYAKRFGPYFVEPLVAGLVRKNEIAQFDKVSTQEFGKQFPTFKDLQTESKDSSAEEELVPFVCGMDLIGAIGVTNKFAVSGTAADGLFGAAESFYKDGMNEDELFEAVSQTLQAAVDRDCMSGWGAVVHLLTKDKYIIRELKARQD